MPSTAALQTLHAVQSTAVSGTVSKRMVAVVGQVVREADKNDAGRHSVVAKKKKHGSVGKLDYIQFVTWGFAQSASNANGAWTSGLEKKDEPPSTVYGTPLAARLSSSSRVLYAVRAITAISL